MDLVDIGISGELDDYIKDMQAKNYIVDHRKLLSIEEFYREYSEWEIRKEKYSETNYEFGNNENLLTKYPSLPEEYKGVGRNEKCPCGSGLKFKKCHGK